MGLMSDLATMRQLGPTTQPDSAGAETPKHISQRCETNRRRDAFCCHITSCDLLCRSWIRQGSLPHLDLSIMSADLKAWLRVYGGSVNDMAIFKIKPGSVVRTFNAVVHELTVGKRPAKMRTGVGHCEEMTGATD